MFLFELFESLRLDEGYKEVSNKFTNEVGNSDEVKKFIDMYRELSNKNRLSGKEKDINFWGKGSFSDFKNS